MLFKRKNTNIPNLVVILQVNLLDFIFVIEKIKMKFRIPLSQ